MTSRLHTVQKWAFRGSILLFGTAVYQGVLARQEFFTAKRLLPPTGPSSGVIKWTENIQDKLSNLKNKVKTKKDVILHDLDLEEQKLRKKIEESIQEWKQKALETKNKIKNDSITGNLHHPLKSISSDIKTNNNPNITIKRKKIKLLLLGDSLACGVGCEDTINSNSNGPELPKMLAKVLSIALRREIEWYSAGIVGATADDIKKQLIPDKRKEILTTLFPNLSEKEGSVEDCKLVVVVLCGLNDWRTSLEKFPWGDGLSSFQNNLQEIVSEVKLIADAGKCEYQVFFPAIPINLIASDPTCFFTERPLKDVVEFISWLWDMQKQAIARDDSEHKTWYIDVPSLQNSTPAEGLVSSDRVHPSVHGYQYWAMHLAHEIIPLVD